MNIANNTNIIIKAYSYTDSNNKCKTTANTAKKAALSIKSSCEVTIIPRQKNVTDNNDLYQDKL